MEGGVGGGGGAGGQGRTSVRALLGGLIDYAGLFPPAALDMPTAVRNYASYRDGEHAWMLGRFIVPAARLSEFDAAVIGLAGPWRLSCVGQAILPAAGFSAGSAGKIESVELKIEKPADIKPAKIVTYYEIPRIEDAATYLPALAWSGARTKVRTGGLTAGAFPSSIDLARFLTICAEARVPFKATAGLHHPLRSVHRLTYEADSPMGMMHGFLNVFLAAALAYSGLSEEDVVATVEEIAPDAFQFDDEGVSWHSHRLTTNQLHAARQNFSIGFGSCSFEEPVADLRALGLL